jgi:large subunit ribosomal protein L9
MDVILLERVEKLGQMGDLVRVKDGFARNFLLPRGKALRATEDNKKRFEAQKAELEARNLERKSEAEAVGKKLDGESIVIIRQAGESGQLYGSVAARDIAEALSEKGFHVDKHQVILDKPVKTLGLFDQRVQLHPEVIATVTVNVARSQEEAERLARGEDVLATPEEREAALEIEEVFEEEVIAEVAEELAATEGAEGEEAPAQAASEETSEEETEEETKTE